MLILGVKVYEIGCLLILAGHKANHLETTQKNT